MPTVRANSVTAYLMQARSAWSFGSDCRGGCRTGSTAPDGTYEDDINRTLAQKVYAKLDASAEFHPGLSRWVQNNNNAAADWDRIANSLPESNMNRKDRAWYDRAAHANQLATGSRLPGPPHLSPSCPWDAGSMKPFRIPTDYLIKVGRFVIYSPRISHLTDDPF
jgi:hypothetical protein